MSLDYAILGFLNYEPMTGYDLKKFFDDSVRHFWHADQSQIYRSLNNLKKQSWVAMEVIEQLDRPDRKVYSITVDGQRQLKEWLISIPKVNAPHSAPLIQVFFSGMLPDQMVLELFERNKQIMEGVLHSFDPIPGAIETYKREVHSEREAYFWGLTHDLGMRIAKAQLEWAQDVIKDIQNNKIPKK